MNAEVLLHGLTGALLAFVSERVVHWWMAVKRRRSIWEHLTALNGGARFAISTTPTSHGGPTIRTCDFSIMDAVRHRCGWRREEQLPMQPKVERLDLLNVHLFIVGSPKFNRYAEMVQREFETEMEFVWDLYQGEPESRLLKIVTRHGDEYVATRDLMVDHGGTSVDYGIFFHGVLSNGKQVFWLAGIHGPATVGVWKCLQNQPELFSMVNKTSVNEARTWLFRITYNVQADPTRQESLENILKIDQLGSVASKVRPRRESEPKALIFDLGNVLMLFDRSRTYRAIAHVLQINWKDVKDIIEGNGITASYERGEMTTEDFRKQICSLLKIRESKLPESLFAEFWGDIFWANTKMIEVLQQCAQVSELTLVLLSNTNELHYQDVRNNFPEVVAPFSSRIVLSYQEHCDKSTTEIFNRAVARAGVPAQQCVYIDDKKENVAKAVAVGMKGLIYFKYPQFIVRLRELGIYLP